MAADDDTDAPSAQRSRRARRDRPRAPRSTQTEVPSESNSPATVADRAGEETPAGLDDREIPPENALPQPLNGQPDAETKGAAAAKDAIPSPEAPLVFAPPGKRGSRKTATRAKKKEEAAAAALAGTEANPGIGALNRHLNTMTQQLTTAHRLLGRISAERDALRQQLADLQGIPVDEIVVTTLGAPADQAVSTSASAEPAPPTVWSRLNYFGGDDFALMRKRRQTFVLGLLLTIVSLWLVSKMVGWAMPGNLNRESLGQIPYVGDLITVFLAGWLLFRVVRVSSKGVRWVFPSDDSKRRRR